MPRHPHRPRSDRFTIGVLSGWQVYHIYINSFIEGVYNGIQAAAEVYNADLLFACGINQIAHSDLPSPIRPAWPVLSPDTTFVPVGKWNTQGLIAISPLLSADRSAYIHQLMREGHPVMLVGSEDTSPVITYDHKAGIMQSVAHLVEHGHQRIAFVAGHPNEIDRDSSIRLDAYREAVRLHGLDDDPDLIVFGRHSHEGGRMAMRELLSRSKRFTAAVASNDELAVGAMQICKQAGIRIPDDLAIIGFDNRLEAAAQEPPLSTIQIPLFEVGFRACEALIQHLRGTASLADFRDETIPVRLVLRESCGCAPRREVSHLDDLPDAIALTGASAEDALQAVIGEIVDQVSADITHLARHEINDHAQQLMQAFLASVQIDDPALFLSTLLRTLDRMEGIGETTYAWQNAISLTEAALPRILSVRGQGDRCEIGQRLLFEAQSTIGKRTRQQHIDYIIDSDWLADQLGQLNAYLSSLMDEAKIFDLLANHLPSLGMTDLLVKQIDVVLFDAENDDLPQWSTLATRPTRGQFETTQFPPTGLYPDQRRVIALLPLLIDDQQVGYVAFNHALLRICANVVRGISTALQGAKLYQRAISAQQMAEEANRMKSRFLSTVSHELRTPLVVIIGSSDVLMRELSQQASLPAIAEHLDDLKRIQASARHLNSLIGDVLDLTQSEVGHLSLNCERIDLGETLKPILDVAQQMVEDKGLIWQAGIDVSMPPLWGDKVRLRQVVLNLVSNAAKFTDSGEVKLTVGASDGVITIEVCDTGVGIPLDEQHTIFGEFEQSARTAGRGYQGLGLGLTICRRLVEMHGGTISVQSHGEEGKGSMFRVLLPTVDGSLATVSPRSDQRVVLVVDDDPLTRRTHERILFTQLPNARILTAHNGSEALNIVSVDRPDLIVLDLVMPELDGFAVVEALREHPEGRGIPVIVLSGKVLDDAEMKRLSKGVLAILNKGVFGADEILIHVERALSGQHRIGDSTQMLVRSAMSFMHENYMQPITREQIAGHISVNEDYLTACFQRELGMSPITYLNRYRISRAKILITTTSMSLTEIALEVGFASSTYFSRVFRREAGVSPSEYRA